MNNSHGSDRTTARQAQNKRFRVIRVDNFEGSEYILEVFDSLPAAEMFRELCKDTERFSYLIEFYTE